MEATKGGRGGSFFCLRHFFCTFFFLSDEVSLSYEQMTFLAPSELPLA